MAKTNQTLERDIVLKKVFNFWKTIDKQIEGIYDKFANVNGKTGKYDVPDELWTQRTRRTNRVLLEWDVIRTNEILQDINNLKLFENGICIEFVNNDFDDHEKSQVLNKLKATLKRELGGDNTVSCIRTVRNIKGDIGGKKVRDYFEINALESKFVKDLIKRKPADVHPNYNHIGNEDWEGKYFFSIKGGSTKSYLSHPKNHPMLFNPASEYANKEVCTDIIFVLSFFAMHCKDLRQYCTHNDLTKLKKDLEAVLKSRSYLGLNLYKYCINHFSMKYSRNILIDPITTENILIEFFGLESIHKIELCHSVPVSRNEFLYDNKLKYILSSARPTNLFWGFRESNLIQQTSTLEQYYNIEKERVNTRNSWRF